MPLTYKGSLCIMTEINHQFVNSELILISHCGFHFPKIISQSKTFFSFSCILKMGNWNVNVSVFKAL